MPLLACCPSQESTEHWDGDLGVTCGGKWLGCGVLLVDDPWGGQHCPSSPPSSALCPAPLCWDDPFAAWLLHGWLGQERGFLTGAGAYF